jgi:RNA polymerase sigma-70 factor (ECF subfamily)
VLSTLDDTALIAEIKQHNMAAFRALYYRHVDTVHALVVRLVGNSRLDVEDLVQEIFFQVHRSVATFEGASGFKTWLHRVAVNVCFSHLRKRSTFGEVQDRDGTPERASYEDREARVDARRKIQKMFALIDGLAVENRTVFTLYELEGLSLAEVAKILDIPLHTAASRLRRSREYLVRGFVEKRRYAEGGKS